MTTRLVVDFYPHLFCVKLLRVEDILAEMGLRNFLVCISLLGGIPSIFSNIVDTTGTQLILGCKQPLNTNRATSMNSSRRNSNL